MRAYVQNFALWVNAAYLYYEYNNTNTYEILLENSPISITTTYREG